MLCIEFNKLNNKIGLPVLLFVFPLLIPDRKLLWPCLIKCMPLHCRHSQKICVLLVLTVPCMTMTRELWFAVVHWEYSLVHPVGLERYTLIINITHYHMPTPKCRVTLCALLGCLTFPNRHLKKLVLTWWRTFISVFFLQRKKCQVSLLARVHSVYWAQRCK